MRMSDSFQLIRLRSQRSYGATSPPPRSAVRRQGSPRRSTECEGGSSAVTGEDGLEAQETVVEAGRLFLVLGEEGFQRRVQPDGAIDVRVRSRPVGPDADQFLH